MKKLTLFAFILVVLSVPLQSKALTTQEAYENSLRALISLLMEQIAVLQKQLAIQQAAENHLPSLDELMQSTFYSGAYEALYAVRGNTLIPLGGTIPSSSHQMLWNRYVALAGDSFVRSEIGEFRLYSSRQSPYDAFTELDTRTGEWIFAVNIYHLDMNNPKIWEGLDPLFVHEIGHIAVTDRILEDFTDTFWDRDDEQHAERVARLEPGAYRDSVVSEYFESNVQKFVTEYATISPLEDAVESFTAYAMGYPTYRTGARKDKIEFYNSYQDMQDLRAQIQNSL